MRRLRVAYDLRGSQAHGQHLKGGIARWIEGIGAELASREDLDVVGFADPSMELSGTGMSFAAQGRLSTPMEIAAEEPDVLHLTSPFESARRRALLPAGLLGSATAVVTTLHDAIPLVPSLPYPEALRRWWRRRAEVVVESDRVVCLSRFAASEGVSRLGIDPRKLRVVGTGAPPHAMAAQAAGPLPIGVEEPFVLYTGGSSDGRKNVAGLIAAFGLLPQRLRRSHQLVVASWLPPDMRAHLERVATDAGVAGEVRLCGWVDDAVLAGLLARCSAFVYPSLHEGFGYPILEGMAAGAPVLASRTTGCGEVLGHPRATFEPTDPRSIATALEHVLVDDEFRAELREFGAERSRAFRWDAAADRLVQAYREAATTASGRSPRRASSQAVFATLTLPSLGAPTRAVLTVAEATADVLDTTYAGFHTRTPGLAFRRCRPWDLASASLDLGEPVACLVDTRAAAAWALQVLRARHGIAVFWDLDDVLEDPDLLRAVSATAMAIVVRDRLDFERVGRVLGRSSTGSVHMVEPPLGWTAAAAVGSVGRSADVVTYGGGPGRDLALRARRLPLVCAIRPEWAGAFAPGTLRRMVEVCDALGAIGSPAAVRLAGKLASDDLAAAGAGRHRLPPRLVVGEAPAAGDLLALATAAAVHVVLASDSRSTTESLIDVAGSARRPVVAIGAVGAPRPGLARLGSETSSVRVARSIVELLDAGPVEIEPHRRPESVAAALLAIMEGSMVRDRPAAGTP